MHSKAYNTIEPGSMEERESAKISENQQAPKISVIVPVYNVEQYIERCVRSLLEQTLDNIEYIFVDDCSSDNSIPVLKDILEYYPKRRDFVKIIQMQENCGVAAVRKKGILAAKGDYIIHCDSDDWLELYAYENLYSYAIAGNHDIVFFDFFRSDGNQKTLVKRKIDFVSKEKLFSQLLSGSIMGSLCGGLIKSSLYRNMIFPQYDMIEDLTMMIQLVYNSESFAYLQEPLYYYYYNPNSITSRFNKEKAIRLVEHYKSNLDQIVNFMHDKKLYNTLSFEIESSKMRAKLYLSQYMLDTNIRATWASMYPEITFQSVYRSKYLPIDLKIIYIMSVLGIYPLIKRIRFLF